MSERYPYVSSFEDRHGTRRWRFRRGSRAFYLTGQPGEPAFEAEYQAAIAGVEIRKAEVRRLPTAAEPRTLNAAWRLARQDPQWLKNTPATRARHEAIAREFLDAPIAEGQELLWGAMPVADLRRRHIKLILADRIDTPHAARHLLTRIRQMIVAALDAEWIETDPTYKVKWRPDYVGWRAWTDDERARYEKRWPVGTTARLVYALAIWQGHRRSDIARVRPEDISGDLVSLTQQKTGKRLSLPIVAMLQEVFDATDMSGPTVLKTIHGQPFSAKSLTGHMALWTHKAGLPKGCTIHGLRKTLGKLMAEGGASTRAMMDMLGHDDMKHAELYSEEADQVRMARQGIDAAVRAIGAKKPAV